MRNFGGSYMGEPRPGFRKEVISKYHDIMGKRGYKGLVYHNTSPQETGNRAKRRFDLRRHM
jgi:hypothetical protein